MALQDRTIEVHTNGGRYFQAWVPWTPRVCEYYQYSADLLIGTLDSSI